MRYRAHAIFDVDRKEDQAVAPWKKKWKRDIKRFEDSGCGCCVVILDFEASEEAIADLEARTGHTLERKPL